MQWAEQLESTSVGLAIAESRYAFAIIEGAHLIGLSVSVGLIFITDLRLMGLLFRQRAAERCAASPAPVDPRGLRQRVRHGRPALLGGSLDGDVEPRLPVEDAVHPARGPQRRVLRVHHGEESARGGEPSALPASVKFAGAASLTLWTLVVIFGRLIPYMPGEH